MKITRAYTVDRETIEILKKKSNKSQYVCRAVKRLHTNERELSLWEIPVAELLQSAAIRGSCPAHISAVIFEFYQIHK